MGLAALGYIKPIDLILADLITLPLNLFLELGVFFILGCIQVRRWIRSTKPLSETDVAGIVIGGASLTVCLVVRSNTIDSNDLGMRGMLIIQFFLLLWSTDLLLGCQLAYTGRIVLLRSLGCFLATLYTSCGTCN